METVRPVAQKPTAGQRASTGELCGAVGVLAGGGQRSVAEARRPRLAFLDIASWPHSQIALSLFCCTQERRSSIIAALLPRAGLQSRVGVSMAAP